MKNKIDGILVVEGKSDVGYLSSFIDALFFITNGSDINEEKLDFLSRASKVNNIIILTDPDGAGERIRNIIKSKINGVFVANISKNSRKTYVKHGVAEAEKEEILEVLKNFITDKEVFKEKYDLVSLISLSENPEEKREQIINKYRLIKGNNNYLENQLRILRISKEELWK